MKRTYFKRKHSSHRQIGTVAPINKKPGTGSTGKSGAGGLNAKSGKTGSSLGSGSKSGGVFGSSGKSKSNSTFGSESKKTSAFVGSGSKFTSTFGVSGKSTNDSSKTASFLPLGSGKPSTIVSSKKPSVPLLIGGKTTSAFASSPSKSYPSTSFSSPKRTSTSFGFIWIPGRKHNKKKEYVHVSHRDDGYKERSPSMYPHENNYMSGDSPNHQPFKKKEEETSLAILERPKGPIATAASAGTAVVALDDKNVPNPANTDPVKPEEKSENPEYNRYDEKEETKDAAGDAAYKEDSKAFLDNYCDSSKSLTDEKTKNDRGDKVDSVYLRPPPPHKVRSNTSTNDEEDCGIKCLYYTLQCCDCVLM